MKGGRVLTVWQKKTAAMPGPFQGGCDDASHQFRGLPNIAQYLSQFRCSPNIAAQYLAAFGFEYLPFPPHCWFWGGF